MWQIDAACGTDNQDLFFSELASKVTRAKNICASCPSRQKCLDFAISEDVEFGIFGGMTPAERKALVNA